MVDNELLASRKGKKGQARQRSENNNAPPEGGDIGSNLRRGREKNQPHYAFKINSLDACNFLVTDYA
jgi:hypothetical protein